MYINDSGKIIAIKYFVNAKTELTPVELEKFEEALKRNVSFNLSKEDDVSGYLAPIIQSIHFEKVLNKSFSY